ncbi:hypothetical protein ACFFK0_07860 [Paenibacillus chartarius]|uniref:Uncharacterized protein n=1 Tax=Paenibacillus chartarius TaxID=747481 RepID=A0ABV6DI94_9BACL
MEAMLIVLIVMVAVIIAFNAANRKNSASPASRRPVRRPEFVPYDRSKLPPRLGLLHGVPLADTENRLLQAFDDAFGNRVVERMLDRYPRMSVDEAECRLFELKRYFLMGALLRSTPMFSDEVDDVWHEMLMFTREYERFGQSFVGATIHHAPHAGKTEMPGERAWFDWLYAHLFEATPYSSRLWHGFCRYPMDRGQLKLLAEGDPAELRQKYFHAERADAYPDIGMTIERLIRQAKEELRYAGEQTHFEREQAVPDYVSGALLGVSAAMLFYSMSDSGSFEQGMEQVLTPEEEEQLRKNEDTSSGCSYSSCSYGSSDDQGGRDNDGGRGGDGGYDSGDSGGSGGSDHGDGGSSSCSSSSGSSCGSSCGGGGD